jgi:hypothetical protein
MEEATAIRAEANERDLRVAIHEARHLVAGAALGATFGYVKAKADKSWRFWGLYVHVCKMETLREAYELAEENDGGIRRPRLGPEFRGKVFWC